MNSYEPRMRELKGMLLGYKQGEKPVRVSEEEIANAERQLGASLPADYREFVRDFGMFYFLIVTFPLPANSEGWESGSVGSFNGIFSDPNKMSFDLLTVYNSMFGGIDAWPENFIPIAVGNGTSSVAMSFKGEDKGCVYDFVEFTYFFLVAESFDEFMQLLENHDDEPEAEEAAAEFWMQYRRAD